MPQVGSEGLDLSLIVWPTQLIGKARLCRHPGQRKLSEPATPVPPLPPRGRSSCLTVAADATMRLETTPGARNISIFDPMAVGGGETCWWISAVSGAGESARVAAAGLPTAAAGSPGAPMARASTPSSVDSQVALAEHLAVERDLKVVVTRRKGPGLVRSIVEAIPGRPDGDGVAG